MITIHYLILRKFTATRLNEERDVSFDKYPELMKAWLVEYEEAEASQNFLNGIQNYPLLKGVQTNLYKCFLPQAWLVGNTGSVTGFLHPEGVFDDPKGGGFRAEIYPRLRAHFQLWNGLFLFPEVHDQVRFGINIYACAQNEVSFNNISNLYAPQTIDMSFRHNGEGEIPGIKDDEGKWSIKGHRSRILRVDNSSLETFAQLYDEAACPCIASKTACYSCFRNYYLYLIRLPHILTHSLTIVGSII